MKALLAALGGFFDMLPGWLWAALLAGMALQSCGQGNTIADLKLQVATAQAAKAKADTALSDRIGAEARTVAAAVQVARYEEQVKQDKQKELINELHTQNAAAAAGLVDAQRRVRLAIYGIATAGTGAGGADLPKGAGLACRTQDGAGAEFQAASGILADRLLQLADKANEVTRERNICVALHQ